MIVPNKTIPYNVSLLSKLPIILRRLRIPAHPVELYHELQSNFDDLSQFLLTLDVLYVLGKISFDGRNLSLC